MSNQYEVLGKAPGAEDLKKLSSNDIHLTIKNMNAGYGKMEILHNFDLYVIFICYIHINFTIKVNNSFCINFLYFICHYIVKLAHYEQISFIFHKKKH